jgi:hypothetical protein
LFYQDNCQESLVLQEITKTSLLGHREATGSWTQGVLLHWHVDWDKSASVKQNKNKAKVHPPDRIKKDLKKVSSKKTKKWIVCH